MFDITFDRYLKINEKRGDYMAIKTKYNIGDKFDTKLYGQVELLEYLGKSKWKIKFINTGYECDQYINNILNGSPQDRSIVPKFPSKFSVGNIITRKDGVQVEIIKSERKLYKNEKRTRERMIITIKFLDTGYITKCFADMYSINSILDRLKPRVHNHGILGYIDDLPFEGNVKNVLEYKLWEGIIRRCYSNSMKEKNKSYKTAVMCEEWLRFDKFYYDIQKVIGYDKWKEYKLNNPKKKNIYELDKDIKGNGSKIYCRENCMFIPKEINAGFTSWASDETKQKIIHKLKTEYGYEIN